MAKGWRKFSREKVLKAINGSGGIKMLICQRVGCDRYTLDKYLKEDEIILKAYQTEIDELGDVVESKIINRIKDGSETMMIFYAKTKLKSRGYVERQEVDSVTPLVLKFDTDDAKA